jgi:hypothetical protein
VLDARRDVAAASRKGCRKTAAGSSSLRPSEDQDVVPADDDPDRGSPTGRRSRRKPGSEAPFRLSTALLEGSRAVDEGRFDEGDGLGRGRSA